jgi:hypothetical protein
MKVYDYQWSATFGMGARAAAAELSQDGIDTALIRNQIDPLPGSGVDQNSYLAGSSLAAAADRDWSNALHEAGLTVYQTTALFFEPKLVDEFPDARPVDARGRPSEGFDWYLGVCPTHDGYLDTKVERLQRMVAELAPDGLFLSFTRYPGFWENWVPGYVFSDADRFCFCDRCRQWFAAELGIDLPAGDVATQAQAILTSYGEEWTAWRSARIVEAIAKIVAAVRGEQAELPIMLNTLPFPASDFGGRDVRREIAAQDLSSLGSVVDHFELMTYLQILDRPDAWLGEVVADARRALPDRALFCTLQVAPLYTDGIHAGRGRATEISSSSLERAARAALAAGANGLVFYHWTDFLIDEVKGGSKRSVLRELSRG